MKKLQSNFTTPKQSKQLLDLGVPKWTADCVYDSQGRLHIAPNEYIFEDCPTLLPCWSVGRLIEIYGIVGENAGQCVSTKKSTSRTESLVQLYEENATLLDFSKLEE